MVGQSVLRFLRNEDGFIFVLPRVRDRHVLIRSHDYVRKAGSKADEAVVHEYAAGRLFRTSYFKEGRGLRRFTIWDGQKEREDGALVSGPGLLSDCSLAATAATGKQPIVRSLSRALRAKRRQHLWSAP
jgi:hypothetical protein